MGDGRVSWDSAMVDVGRSLSADSDLIDMLTTRSNRLIDSLRTQLGSSLQRLQDEAIHVDLLLRNVVGDLNALSEKRFIENRVSDAVLPTYDIASTPASAVAAALPANSNCIHHSSLEATPVISTLPKSQRNICSGNRFYDYNNNRNSIKGDKSNNNDAPQRLENNDFANAAIRRTSICGEGSVSSGRSTPISVDTAELRGAVQAGLAVFGLLPVDELPPASPDVSLGRRGWPVGSVGTTAFNCISYASRERPRPLIIGSRPWSEASEADIVFDCDESVRPPTPPVWQRDGGSTLASAAVNEPLLTEALLEVDNEVYNQHHGEHKFGTACASHSTGRNSGTKSAVSDFYNTSENLCHDDEFLETSHGNCFSFSQSNDLASVSPTQNVAKATTTLPPFMFSTTSPSSVSPAAEKLRTADSHCIASANQIGVAAFTLRRSLEAAYTQPIFPANDALGRLYLPPQLHEQQCTSPQKKNAGLHGFSIAEHDSAVSPSIRTDAAGSAASLDAAVSAPAQHRHVPLNTANQLDSASCHQSKEEQLFSITGGSGSLNYGDFEKDCDELFGSQSRTIPIVTVSDTISAHLGSSHETLDVHAITKGALSDDNGTKLRGRGIKSDLNLPVSSESVNCLNSSINVSAKLSFLDELKARHTVSNRPLSPPSIQAAHVYSNKETTADSSRSRESGSSDNSINATSCSEEESRESIDETTVVAIQNYAQQKQINSKADDECYSAVCNNVEGRRELPIFSSKLRHNDVPQQIDRPTVNLRNNALESSKKDYLGFSAATERSLFDSDSDGSDIFSLGKTEADLSATPIAEKNQNKLDAENLSFNNLASKVISRVEATGAIQNELNQQPIPYISNIALGNTSHQSDRPAHATLEKGVFSDTEFSFLKNKKQVTLFEDSDSDTDESLDWLTKAKTSLLSLPKDHESFFARDQNHQAKSMRFSTPKPNLKQEASHIHNANENVCGSNCINDSDDDLFVTSSDRKTLNAIGIRQSTSANKTGINNSEAAWSPNNSIKPESDNVFLTPSNLHVKPQDIVPSRPEESKVEKHQSSLLEAKSDCMQKTSVLSCPTEELASCFDNSDTILIKAASGIPNYLRSSNGDFLRDSSFPELGSIVHKCTVENKASIPIVCEAATVFSNQTAGIPYIIEATRPSLVIKDYDTLSETESQSDMIKTKNTIKTGGAGVGLPADFLQGLKAKQKELGIASSIKIFDSRRQSNSHIEPNQKKEDGKSVPINTTTKIATCNDSLTANDSGIKEQVTVVNMVRTRAKGPAGRRLPSRLKASEETLAEKGDAHRVRSVVLAETNDTSQNLRTDSPVLDATHYTQVTNSITPCFEHSDKECAKNTGGSSHDAKPTEQLEAKSVLQSLPVNSVTSLNDTESHSKNRSDASVLPNLNLTGENRAKLPTEAILYESADNASNQCQAVSNPNRLSDNDIIPKSSTRSSINQNVFWSSDSDEDDLFGPLSKKTDNTPKPLKSLRSADHASANDTKHKLNATRLESTFFSSDSDSDDLFKNDHNFH